MANKPEFACEMHPNCPVHQEVRSTVLNDSDEEERIGQMVLHASEVVNTSCNNFCSLRGPNISHDVLAVINSRIVDVGC